MSFTYAPGSKPLSRYTIRRGIGIGGFGEVYFAVSEAGKEVALKRIQRNLEVELRGVSHCLNLKHPNLVAIYDVCRDSADQAWVVMEYIAGPNLRQVLDAAPDGLPESEVRRWFASIGAGVEHLHSAGLVHRDLKPGNVFDDLGVIKVGDYGLSKFISTSHRGGQTESVGTFHYMAPEIGRGEYGREIDIYALGVLLYEMLTGRVPFDGESCHEIIVKHLTASPDLSIVPDPYRRVIRQALAKDPASRPGSVGEMLKMIGISGGGSAEFLGSRSQPHTSTAAFAADPDPIEAKFASAKVSSEAASSPPRASRRVQRDKQELASREPLVAGARGAAAATTLDEPLARAVRNSFADLSRWWSTLDRSPGAKVFLAITAVVVLLINTHWLLPLLSLAATVYVPYYIVRQMVLHSRQQPSYAQAQRISTAHGIQAKPLTRTQWRSQMRTQLRAKHSAHRLAELSTSWVVATILAVGLVLAAGVVGLRNGPVDAMSIAPYGWIMVMVLLSSLAILGLGKLWERDNGEGLPRRMVMAGTGAGIGVLGYGLQHFLMVPTDVGALRDIDAARLPQALYVNGTPLASAMMAHFAVLFAVLRWWRSVDPLRRTRLSLWAVAVTVVVEWLLHQLIPIPQPAGMLVAGGIAIAVQMSAPWIDPRAEAKQAVPETSSIGRAA